MRRITVDETGASTNMPLERWNPGTDHRRKTWQWALALSSLGLALSACSLHITKHGITGNVFGHKFSGATGVLPAGFPSSVPVPDNSRVLVGGGTNNQWDVAFAVTGSLSSGTAAYEAKFRSAGYTVTNIETGSTPATAATGSGSNSTSTTVTLTGSVFTATDAQWTVQVESGSTTSSTGGTLKAGEFAINITVVPTSSTTSST